jgi:hypothetical protein
MNKWNIDGQKEWGKGKGFKFRFICRKCGTLYGSPERAIICHLCDESLKPKEVKNE